MNLQQIHLLNFFFVISSNHSSLILFSKLIVDLSWTFWIWEELQSDLAWAQADLNSPLNKIDLKSHRGLNDNYEAIRRSKYSIKNVKDVSIKRNPFKAVQLHSNIHFPSISSHFLPTSTYHSFKHGNRPKSYSIFSPTRKKLVVNSTKSHQIL